MEKKRGAGFFQDYNIEKEGSDNVLWINYEDTPRVPSIEDDPLCMAKTVDVLISSPGVTKIVFSQKHDYEYSYDQVKLLQEMGKLYKKLVKDKKLFSFQAINTLAVEENKYSLASRYNEIHDLVFSYLLKDPIGCYVEIKRALRREKIELDKEFDDSFIRARTNYVKLLEFLLQSLENTSLIQISIPYLAGYKVGSREIYRKVFNPSIKPDFMFTKIMATYPKNGEEVMNYNIGDTEVVIFRLPDNVQYLYHVTPPEFKLSEDKYEVLDMARKILSEHKPEEQDFVNPERMREVFYNVGTDLLGELCQYRNVKVTDEELEELTQILIRYTVGFGLIEVLLRDENIQDITVNSPTGQTPMYVVHAEFDDCKTNIIPSISDAESWASKLRLLSGRPLDEANPILDTDIEIPGVANARVGVISKPLNPTGIAYAFRRHRDKPWTLPLFIKLKMINNLAAGLLSFLIDGNRTLLVAGTRSAGKSSLLGSLMVEIMRKYRIITIEDTLELPVKALREFEYNIQSMKVASSLSKGSSEVPADEGIRTTLRMGDSALIIGEVRSSLRGDQEIMVVVDGLTRRIPIKDLQNKNLDSVYIPTLNYEQKMELKKLSGFAKHPKCSQLIKLLTKTGKEVIVTPDHSVFTHVNFKIAAINTDKLKKEDPIIIPSKLPNSFNNIDYINLVEIFKENYRLEGAEEYIRRAINILGWKKASRICNVNDIYRYLLSTQKTRILIKSFIDLMKEANIKYDINNLRIKKGNSNSIPAKFPINESTLRFIGYYLAEGNLSKDKIQITNSKLRIIKDVENICDKEFGLKVSKRKVTGMGKSVQMFIISKPLCDLLDYLRCGRTSLHKRIPEFVYGLCSRKICALLKGMYSGDGSISISKTAGNMVRYYSTSRKLVEDVSYALLSLGIVCRIHSNKAKNIRRKKVFIAEIKQRKYVKSFLKNVGFTHKDPKISAKSFSHSKDDSVMFDPIELEKHLKLPRKYRHLRRTKCCSKDYLKKITEEVRCSDEIFGFAHGDFFIDKIKSIEILNLTTPENVYDLEVKSTQRFIGGFGGILLHNTEAKALYEAMRVGALANVVAGTIHGESPYGVYDRVVNDLEVPRTSFKATDVIIVANPIRSADGLHKWRRVTQITEVRKDWVDDPAREHGFVDLMKYNSKTDELEATDDLLNGDSEVLKSIAGNVKDWAGNWDAVWDSIMLRAKIKETIVKAAEREKDSELLEATFVIKCNDQFHKISDKVKEDTGDLNSKRIFFEFNEWMKTELKRIKQRERLD